MPEVVTIATPALGDRSYLIHDETRAVVVDPQNPHAKRRPRRGPERTDDGKPADDGEQAAGAARGGMAHAPAGGPAVAGGGREHAVRVARRAAHPSRPQLRALRAPGWR
jgi:hypothetical protein